MNYKKIVVAGGGVLGSQIAFQSAYCGYDVTIWLRSEDSKTRTQPKLDALKKDYIKRCIALEGDKVEIIDKKLFVNDKEVQESYVDYADSEVYTNFSLFENQEEYQQAWEKGKFATLPPAFVRDNFGPVIIPKGHYMVMGDNRDYSFDSRYWGPLPDKYLKGKALIVYWPINRIKLIS